MSGTTQPTVFKRLVETLEGRAALNDIQVSYGWPTEPESVLIYTGGARGESRLTGMRAGTKPTAESYEIDVLIEVSLSDADQYEVDTVCAALHDEVASAVAEDPHIGTKGTGVQVTLRFASWEHHPAPSPEGRYAGRRLTFHVDGNRIT